MKEEKKKLTWKQLWKLTWTRILGSPNQCIVCGRPLIKSKGQVAYYCSGQCRAVRHNLNRASLS